MQGYEGAMPVMLEMALAKDAVALNYFRGMPYDQQQRFVKGAAGLDDGGAVQAYVAALHGRIRS